MVKTDVLMLNVYYDPEVTSDRHISKAIAEDLAAGGLRVLVRTPVPSRCVGPEIRKAYAKRRLECFCGGRLVIRRFRLFPEHQSLIGRAFRYLLLDLNHFFASLFISARIILVDSTPPLHGFMARCIHKLKGTPYVFFLQDVFPESLVSVGMITEASLLYRGGKRLQHAIYNSASRILVLSEDMARGLIRSGIDRNKVALIMLWHDESIKPVPRAENRIITKFGLDPDKFYVVYGGNIGFAQNVKILAECAGQCALAGDRITFAVFGDGSLKAELDTFCTERGLVNIRLFPMQPYALTGDVYSLGDIAVIPCKKDMGEQNLPSKTWQILAAGTPVVASCDPESALCRTIGDNGLGIACPAEDPGALYKAIKELYNDNPLREAIRERCVRYVEAHHSRKVWTDKLLEILKSEMSADS